MTEKQHRSKVNEIVPGMKVEATEGELGEQDISPAKIDKVKRDHDGRVEAVEVLKGTLFRKRIDVPVDRIQEVDIGEASKVKVDANEQELEALTQPGIETLSHEDQKPQAQEGLLNQVEQQAPTEQGLREMEGNVHVKRPRSSWWKVIGPGFLSETSGNDPSAVTSYAVDGATAGYGHLWLMLLATPLYQAVQFACAKIGRISGKGLSQLLREQYGRPVALLASSLLVLTNVALIAADLAAVGTGLELITGVSWIWFVAPIALVLWYITVFQSFASIKKIFLTMSFVFVAYIVAAFFSHANWGSVLFQTFVPHISFDFASISSAVAILGATISPYSMFWQTQGETEEQRSGTLEQQINDAKLDVGSGAIAGQLVAYFIIVCTASTLFIHHESIHTAADAAHALEPLVGPLARYLFAIGLIGSGLIAIPVLLASTSYAVTGTFGWPSGLSKRPWQSEGFYLILTIALAVGLGIALLHVNPISLIFWANVLAGTIAPLLILAILLVGNNRHIMQQKRLTPIHNGALILLLIIMVAAVALLFYGLATGQRS